MRYNINIIDREDVPMNLSFAPAKMDELDAIMKIEQAGFNQEEAATRQAMQERIQLISDTFIVAHDEAGKVLGYIVGPASPKRYISDDLFERVAPNRKTDPYLTVLSLAVDPNYRGQGIGGQLLDLFSMVAQQQNRGAVTLTCLKELVPFYESHGYINEGKADSQHAGETWYNLVKML